MPMCLLVQCLAQCFKYGREWIKSKAVLQRSQCQPTEPQNPEGTRWRRALYGVRLCFKYGEWVKSKAVLLRSLHQPTE